MKLTLGMVLSTKEENNKIYGEIEDDFGSKIHLTKTQLLFLANKIKSDLK
jgi:hypothetical protein